MSITMYKIRSRVTGLYSTGGNWPTWSKKGKTWNERAHVSSHLSGLNPAGRRVYRDNDAEVVTCVIREEGTENVFDWLDNVLKRKADREAAVKEAHAEREKAWRYAEYQKLKKEFGDH